MCTIKRLAEQIYKSGVPYEHTLIVNSDVFDAFMKIVGKKVSHHGSQDRRK